MPLNRLKRPLPPLDCLIAIASSGSDPLNGHSSPQSTLSSFPGLFGKGVLCAPQLNVLLLDPHELAVKLMEEGVIHGGTL
ncbi:hypothetical protein [Kitasatospora sp. NPDC090308]|uniref:hypothetical protein n=1 Tax=Kitasatospora sp. NPDC090308 TaxID=3364082 RepID=UPI0037F5CB7F